MEWTAIDFEASCLPRDGRSFPIEIGIADERGARSWLIRPEPGWALWQWTAEAEALHGLSRDRLAHEGLPAAEVMAAVLSDTAGRRLVADSHLDGVWMETLAAAAGCVRADTPKVGHVAEFLYRLGSTDAEIRQAQAAQDRLDLRRHRARDDAAWLFGLVQHLRVAAEARVAVYGRPLFPWAAAVEPVAAPLGQR